MRIVEGQFIQVWPDEAQLGQCVVDLQYLVDVRISCSFGTEGGGIKV